MLGILKGKKKTHMVNLTRPIVSEAIQIISESGHVKGSLATGKPAYGNRPNTAKFCATGALQRAAGVLKYSSTKGWHAKGTLDLSAADKVAKTMGKNPLPYYVKDIPSAIQYGRDGGKVPTAYVNTASFNDDASTSNTQIIDFLKKVRASLPA